MPTRHGNLHQRRDVDITKKSLTTLTDDMVNIVFLFKIVENGAFKNVDSVAGTSPIRLGQRAIGSLDYPLIFHADK